MSTVTARFRVATVAFSGPGDSIALVTLLPAYANGANAAWASATPSGKIELQVNAAGAVEVFNDWRRDSLDLHITIQPVNEIEDQG